MNVRLASAALVAPCNAAACYFGQQNAFFDFRAAYPSVRHAWIFMVLKAYSILDHVIVAITHLRHITKCLMAFKCSDTAFHRLRGSKARFSAVRGPVRFRVRPAPQVSRADPRRAPEASHRFCRRHGADCQQYVCKSSRAVRHICIFGMSTGLILCRQKCVIVICLQVGTVQ